MTLYYGVQQLDLNGVTAQWGMYFRNTNLAFQFVHNAWSSALTSLLEVPNALGKKYIDYMSAADTITFRWVYKIDPFTDLKIDGTSPTRDGAVGTSPGFQLPRSTSVLVLWRPAVVQQNISRWYLPRVTTVELQGGDLHPTTATGVHQLLTQFYTDLTGNLCTPVVRNRKKHTDVPVSTFVVSPRFANVRSRTDTKKPVYL